MSGSFNYLFHLIGFAMVFTSLLAGWIIERRLRTEGNPEFKKAWLRLNRSVGLITPAASVIMLVTGIVNMVSLFPNDLTIWHTQGWLVAKVILFAFLLVNGALFGPIISRKRSKLVRAMIEGNAPADAEKTIRIFDKNITTFYLVQSLLLLVILYLSVFGGGKHPGVF